MAVKRENLSCKTDILKILFIILCFTLNFADFGSAAGRAEKEISGAGWSLYLDRQAQWQNDSLFLPPVDLKTLPVNSPGCGWERLDKSATKNITVPGTVEGYFWSVPRDSAEMTGDYTGVSWWSTKFTVDPGLMGKRITLVFESVNRPCRSFCQQKA